MTLTRINEILMNMHFIDNVPNLKCIKRFADGDFGEEKNQGGEGTEIQIYQLTDESNLYLKVVTTDDSYGDTQGISQMCFVTQDTIDEEIIEYKKNMMNSKEIIKILRDNYTLVDIAYCNFLSTKNLIELTQEDQNLCNQADKEYDAIYKLLERDEDNNIMTNGNGYELLQTSNKFKQDLILTKLGIGSIIHKETTIKKYEWTKVLYVEKHNIYLAINAYCSSYSDLDFEDSTVFEVSPYKKVIQKYSYAKNEIENNLI